MYKELKVVIKGVAPLLCHNGQLADPLNEWAQKIKKISSKSKKTDEDFLKINRLEWFGAFYLDANGQPCIPGENIEAGMIAGAKKNRLGKQMQAGLLSDGLWPILYNGPKDLMKLWESGNFADRRRVKVQNKTVVRVRPVFRVWRLAFSLHYDPLALDLEQVRTALEVFAHSIGLGDYTPKHGRFEVAEFVEV